MEAGDKPVNVLSRESEGSWYEYGCNVTGIPWLPIEASAPNREAHSSGVSWGAVIGGAFVAAALYLILLALGAGFGLSAVSAWSNVGLTATTAGALAIAWLIIIEIVASAFGGYLTGCLRPKWTLVHSDEVFFRDTANAFLVWKGQLTFGLVSFPVRLVRGRAQRAPSASLCSGNSTLKSRCMGDSTSW